LELNSLEPTATVLDLKLAIEDKTGLPIDHQKLRFGFGRRLQGPFAPEWLQEPFSGDAPLSALGLQPLDSGSNFFEARAERFSFLVRCHWGSPEETNPNAASRENA